MKKSTKILVPALAVMALGMAASVTGTVAWYTAEQQAKINVSSATGNLTSTASSIDAGTYTVDLTITFGDSELELSHVATSGEAGTGVAGIAAASLNEGDLIYGVIANNTATMRKCSTATNFISSYSVSAAWHNSVAPTDPADIASLSGKSFTVNLGVDGNAKFLGNDNAVTGQTNQTSASVTVTINANMTFSVGTPTRQYVHIEPTSLSEAEDDTAGSVTFAGAEDISIS